MRQTIGRPKDKFYKEALWNSFDFLHQNSDSSSTGVIEVTRSASSSLIHDLRSSDFQAGTFLLDAAEGRLTFYRSPDHHLTSRSREGQNPEIFSVIRALTKVFQYGLKVSSADWESFQNIVEDFHPERLKESLDPITLKRLIFMGKKLLMHASDIEYAWNILEQLGLRTKLMSFDEAKEAGSLAWWMDREPLRSFPFAEGSGGDSGVRKARDLDLDILTHETRHFLSYEGIHWSLTGEPNVFISRENANYGKGFYTRKGRRGAIGSDISIRFQIHPEAREGIDFIVVPDIEDFVIVLNKAVLTVVPEFLEISPVEFFERLARRDEEFVYPKRGSMNLGVLERFRRRIEHILMSRMDNGRQDLAKILRMLRQELRKVKGTNEFSPFLREWFSLKISANYPYLVKKIIKDGDHDRLWWWVIVSILHHPHWKNYSEFILSLIEKGGEGTLWWIIQSVLPKPHWRNHPEFIQALLQRGGQHILWQLALYFFSKPYRMDHPEFVVTLVQQGNEHTIRVIRKYVLPIWRNHPKLKEFVKWGPLPLPVTVETIRMALARKKALEANPISSCLRVLEDR